MKVDLVAHMGNDDMVVDAARVSFDKIAANYTKEKNEGLLKYLAAHNHWSPFAHPQISLRVSAPIFVARQLGKHQVGLAWNEVSRRYVDYEPTFFAPEIWRKKAENKKQGSADEKVEMSYSIREAVRYYAQEAMALYNELLRIGVCPEQARMVLPQSMYTEWIWTGSLYAFARVCNLRCKPDAQYETRTIADQIEKIIQPLFPVSWSCLRAH